MNIEFEDLLASPFPLGDVSFDDQDLISDLEGILEPMDDSVSKSPDTSSDNIDNEQNQENTVLVFPPPRMAANLSKVFMCTVCQEPAGKHIYFGGRVCPSCRAFFRRAVLSNSSLTFRCQFDKQCVINVITRKDCQYCRYHQCLEAGMKISLVLSESKKRKRRSKDSPDQEIEEIGRTADSDTINLSPALKFTCDDLKYVQMLIDHKQQYNRKTLLQNPRVTIFLARLAYLQGDRFPSNEIHAEHWNNQNTQFMFLGLDGIQSIPLHDQNELLRWNYPLVKTYLLACAFDEPNFGFNQDLHSIVKSGELEPLEDLRQGLEQLQIANKPTMKYDTMFQTPWLSSYADEVKHWELFVKLKRFVKPPENDQPDPVLHMLGRCIVALDHNLPNLRQPEIVQMLQMRYINIMRLYFLAKYKDVQLASERFAEGMKIGSYVRQAVELQHRRLPV